MAGKSMADEAATIEQLRAELRQARGEGERAEEEGRRAREEQTALGEVLRVIAIENARLFSELEQRTAELSQSLEQQTALGEVLRVIADSPTDPQAVLEAISRSALVLCHADRAPIVLV